MNSFFLYASYIGQEQLLLMLLLLGLRGPLLLLLLLLLRLLASRTRPALLPFLLLLQMLAAPVGSAFASGQQPALPASDDDVLMELSEGSNQELAKAARLILDSEAVAKRRRMGT